MASLTARFYESNAHETLKINSTYRFQIRRRTEDATPSAEEGRL